METLFSRLAVLSAELRQDYVEEANVHSAERQAKAHAWQASQATTGQARDREADWQALPNTLALLELRGQIKAREEERDHIMFVIQYRRTT